MKYPLLVPLAICFTGCMVSNGLQYEAAAETNQYHLARVRKGMTEKQVLQIMHKPYSYESFEVDQDIYDVWFYVTRPTGLDQTRMVPQNLTPLTFKNGILVGEGYSWYYYAMKAQAGEMAEENPSLAPVKPKSQEVEDKEFEKALQNRPSSSAPIAPSSSVNISTATKKEAECNPCPNAQFKAARFTGISIGMSETQVLDLVGEPMKYETVEVDSDVYEVWIYETIPSKSGKLSNIPQEITPLTFKNGILVSMSDEDFFALQQQQKESLAAIETPAVTPPAPKQGFFKSYAPKAPLGVTQKTFSKVKKGMSEKEVMDLLGSSTEQESISVGDDVYDVWFYDISSKQTEEPTKKVPLTFKNGFLVATTVKEYNEIKSKAGVDRVGDYDQQDERMIEDESEQNFNYW